MRKPARVVEKAPKEPDPLDIFHPAVRQWFEAVFPDGPTAPQRLGWPAIARGESTLILAPTGTGKTLAAFLWCIERLMFVPPPPAGERCRVLYISPIKALAVDVERNLRAPLVGVAQMARKSGAEIYEPALAIRTGDTPAGERARFSRRPGDILITTPESIYLLLTSNARETLRSIQTVIIDEIHALVPGKRGSHLALSLERLEQLCGHRLQRIGLSATQRPLEEVARFLGGAEGNAAKRRAAKKQEDPKQENPASEILNEFESTAFAPRYRPVTIIDASAPKRLDLRIEVPLEDMKKLDEIEPIPSGPASQGPVRPSIWSAIHPKLLELVLAHRSTLIFVNSRRLAERISGAVNDLAGEVLVRAHHGSVASAQRKEIEERLKTGTLRGIVATSSLELGIDMGAVDLVVQIEAPPSVASGMQRIGRASHHVGGVSAAVIFPKYRGDLVACAAITRAMHEGNVERVAYPRNPLDVLAQQMVAMIAMDTWDTAELFGVITRSAPYAQLPRFMFESVLDMLSGRYPSDEFVELRPRVTWDRVSGKITAREGARRIAVVNGGTIPDRGLFAVFLAGATRGARVGELDEEMVFESRTGDTIILGASTWRIEEITHDRVTVSPAPGEPGKMPFWHGDTAGRPSEFGQKIGEMTRELMQLPRPVAYTRLIEDHDLDANAADNLLRYLDDQAAATGRVPSDQDIVIERCRDELGDWRICVLTPFGSRVHAPWCMAIGAKLKAERGMDVESMWSDDGFVIRVPEGGLQEGEALESEALLPSAAELKDLVLRQLGSTSMFAAKFREAAGRALLLPRRRPGMRAPLWQQRKRAADLMAVAAQYSSFPILLETYRECVRDVLDLGGAADVLKKIERGAIRVTTVESTKPSPFASALLFSYIANYIYEGDAPLAERRAQALAIDQSQLEEILGSTDFRELLDKAAMDEVEALLQWLEPDYQAKRADGVHDLLLKLGDLTAEEVRLRSASPAIASTVNELAAARRVLRLRIGGEARFIPVEYAARYRDALGVPLPPGLAETFLEPVPKPLAGILRRYARTHGPFTTTEVADRYGIGAAEADAVLRGLHGEGKLLEGEFRPGGMHMEWCGPEVLQQIRRKTLARLRREVVPAEQYVFARLLARWHGVSAPRRGLDALLDSIEILQGVELIASDLEREILPARVGDYQPSNLDALLASGEVIWMGREQVGNRDGRISLYMVEALGKLLPPDFFAKIPNGLSERALKILEFLRGQGASFVAAIHQASGGGFPNETAETLWELVWAGLVTNDTFHPVRALLTKKDNEKQRTSHEYLPPGSPGFLQRLRARRGSDGASQGRWSLVEQRVVSRANAAEWSAALAQQMLVRNGIVMRETAAAENVRGGYPAVYPALKTMEENGWVRRGMFVASMGAAQFATAAAVDMLRSLRRPAERPETVHLAASDPANPYGDLVPWLENSSDHNMARAAGASVVLANGKLVAFLRRRNPSIRIFLPDDEPERSQVARDLARRLAEIAIRRQARRSGLLIETINDARANGHFLGRFLEESGFVLTASGYQLRRVAMSTIPSATPEAEDEGDDGDAELEERA